MGGLLVAQPAADGRYRNTSVNNLRQIGLVLALYANENQDQFPLLDQRPETLMADGNALFPEYVGDLSIFGAPGDVRFDPKRSFRLQTVSNPGWHRRSQPGEQHGDCLDTTSYMYLGEMLVSDSDLEKYIREVEGGIPPSVGTTAAGQSAAADEASGPPEPAETDAGGAPTSASAADAAPRPTVYSVPPNADYCVKLGDVASGSLLFRTDQRGLYVPAPTLRTDVDLAVTGIVARGTVRQDFTNPGEVWAEAVYVFPLPEDAAVDHLRMRIGDRVIEGEIYERAEAKRIYVEARDAGQRASLLEQERPNIFTTSVANIAPGETIHVEIEYQQTVRYDTGEMSLRFPTVVPPRFMPGSPTAGGAQGTGWSPDTTDVPDASRITPPVRHPSKGPINPLRLHVDLDAGFPLAALDSPYHDIDVKRDGDGRADITLSEQEVPADRDFVLEWTPAASDAPQAALFTEPREDGAYLLLMMLPPQANALATQPLPREMTFIIDTSGSMSGASILQAKDALSYALRRLSPEDTFNVMPFSGSVRTLFPSPQPATPVNVQGALRYVQQLQAGGGTMMYGPLSMALDPPAAPGRTHQILFFTDGGVGNEEELFTLIHERLGRRRLFPVGIGSAAHDYFMTEAAQFGRGTFTYIGKRAEVAEKMETLLRKMDAPALSSIGVRFQGVKDSEAYPAAIPDLYLGEPVVVAARVDTLPPRATVAGRFGDGKWTTDVALDRGASRPGIAAMWARRKIEALSDDAVRGADQAETRQSIIDVALAYHLVSRYTSLVAVDKTPARAEDDALERHAMEVNLPEEWVYEGVFGPGGDAPARSAYGDGSVPIMRLQNGVERFLMTDTNSAQVGAAMATAVATGSGTVPVVWERPPIGDAGYIHGEPGQYVLYLDGHVEWNTATATSDRFPVSALSRTWMASKSPAPSGDPRDPWGDCTDFVSAVGQRYLPASTWEARGARVGGAALFIGAVIGVALLGRYRARPRPPAP